MDKRLILSVAGSGKTAYVVNLLNKNQRFLIVTYTDNNYANIRERILLKFNGIWPTNVYVYTYFKLLSDLFYKPLFSCVHKYTGLEYNLKPPLKIRSDCWSFYVTKYNKFYSNRLAGLLSLPNYLPEVIKRLEKYFDYFIVDEVQDLAARDFNFLERLMTAHLNMIFVGDFYQHTYDTSSDGNVNKSLFENEIKYKDRFRKQGIKVDEETLRKSWRCPESVCVFIRTKLGIKIESERSDESSFIGIIDDEQKINEIIGDPTIIKLHYQNSLKYGINHKNWGDSKGEDCYEDVCVLLNKNTYKAFMNETLNQLSPSTRNKLYVAITRSRHNVYFIEENKACKFMKEV